MARTRTNTDGRLPKGRIFWRNPADPNGTRGEYASAEVPLGYSTCTDVPGPGDGQALSIRHFSKKLGSATLSGNGPWESPDGWHPFTASSQGPYAATLVGSPTNDYIGVATMAGTNPSKPVADVPVAVVELGDIVKLLKDLGDNLLEAAARTNLSVQFGIRPLVNDLNSILDFSNQIDKRVEALKIMQRDGGVTRAFRKKKPFQTTGTASGKAWPINSIGPQMAADWEVVTTELAWGIAKWVPTTGFPHPNNVEGMRNLARKAVYGLTIDASTAWELIPWSWLIDYGIGVGAYFAAHRNIIPAACATLYACRTTTSVLKYSKAHNANLQYGPMEFITVDKTRGPVPYVTPAAHLPFLSAGQMSIIASLGVLRGAVSLR